ncbi:hypothetical protein COCC4DRAFT_122744 [Bipolaris maydis ATCC 48331]|uniref:Myb-like domain-containing protein n=1 Tax=Cochliobolus heterostrophus (strain C4 / ATCC 48331 / race T) TaxID=665024 RepID=N4XZ38_COCH4|nr:uncharacterized protein COCC4DRAFT_122744 [Bipolaris maydis ATCC 48331]ENI10457.1 hypothetical protein COCC4DRAFT_122744 [Bipolaris maydis ATCC 48331]
MPDPSSAPRRLSLGYILGFSDKPYKDPKLPPLPPRPRRQSQLAELVASPGGLVEWTASDGRKGRLTGMGKPQLTAASLAKVPSGIQPPKEHSKKSTSKKLASNAENQWPTGGWDNLEVTGGSTKSTSKKAPSHKNDVWGGGGFNASVSNKGSQKTASNVENLWGSGDERNAAKATKQATESGDSNETPAPNNTAAEEGEAKKPDDTNTWTKEQDNQLLQMKTENTPWKTIASNLGKPEGQCRTRFKIVKPVDWKPDNATNNAGKGNAGQKDARLDEQKQKQGTKDNNKDSNKEEDKKDSEVPDVSWGGTFGGTFGETSDDKQGEAEKANDTGTWETGDPTKTGDTSDAKDSKDVWINTDGASDSKDNDPVDLWGAAAAGTTAATWDNTNQETSAAIESGWVPNVQQPPSPAKPASAPRSTKAPSESRSRRSTSSKSKPSTTRPAEIELEPDDTFSANDLRLIARILQQDCSMVWSRLSWRFRDKTGRTLDPEVFEKKITGTVEAGWKGE